MTRFPSSRLEKHRVQWNVSVSKRTQLRRTGHSACTRNEVSMILGVSLPRLTPRLLVIVSIMALLVVATRPVFSATSTTVTLGSAGSFAVLAGSTVTNSGPTLVAGDLGVSAGSAITGFPPGIIHGSTHAADAVALQAQNDLTKAYTTLAGMPCSNDLTGKDLGGMNLVPGVYCFSSSAQLTGTLTLNSPTADGLYVFQIVSGLTTASSSVVSLAGSLCGANVFWQIGSSAVLGTGTTFVGNIVALTSITLTTGTNISGRSLARNGAVILDSNHVSNDFSSCGGGTGGKPNFVVTTNANSLDCVAGQTKTLTVTVNGQNGFAGIVKLTSIVLPSTGVTATLSPSSISGTGSSTLSIFCGTAGTYAVDVRAKTTYLSHGVPITVTVTASQTGDQSSNQQTGNPQSDTVTSTSSQSVTPSQTNTGTPSRTGASIPNGKTTLGLVPIAFYSLVVGGLVALVAGTALLMKRGVLSRTRTA